MDSEAKTSTAVMALLKIMRPRILSLLIEPLSKETALLSYLKRENMSQVFLFMRERYE